MVTVSRHTGQGNSRYYLVDGDNKVDPKQRFESVTTITNVLDKPALIPWAEGMGIQAMYDVAKQWCADNPGILDSIESQLPMFMVQSEGASRRKKEDAADIGTETHGIIESILDGGKPDVPDVLTQVIESFKAFWSQANLEIIDAEVMVYSAEHGYAGTIDFIAKNKTGQRWILDWKTSNGLYKETSLQLAAYGYADATMRLKPGEYIWKDLRMMAVRLGKDYPAFETKEVTNQAEAFAGFRACQGIRQWIKDMRSTEWKK
ncbi:hypothetical protein LCGC14_1163590 [marine sediment metagenome]|uniref:PD-(D/E)XK endonuclease-like domain-containing protein n=1 Tax=marine sediment metagenome TaxID=412755 RepID=A0A0F9PXI6_9ZZZZ